MQPAAAPPAPPYQSLYVQVLLFSLLFGFALHAVGERARPIYDFIDRLSQVLFRIVGFVMRLAPLGAFGAMAPMTLLDQLILLAVLLLTSKGAAGVTGSGFIVLAATLSVLGTLPVTALALILGIDRFMSEARADEPGRQRRRDRRGRKWCGALDEQRLQQELRK